MVFVSSLPQSHLDEFVEVSCVLVVKGKEAVEQGIQEDPQAPDVSLGTIVFEALDELWGGRGEGRGGKRVGREG